MYGNDLFQIGTFLVRAPSQPEHLISQTGAFLEDFDNIRDCSVPDSTRFHAGRPILNGGDARATLESTSVGPCSNGSTAASTVFDGGRELRFNVG
ncbi:MAG: hypothetical protein HY830_04700 [Actinobacteria bacterium]|nr:hypothetical protein [Actinomycetota bacterium]